MERSTIDFGIDLGTTNSAVALMKGVVPDVIKSNLDTDITASAVYIGKQGQVQVGGRARGRMEIAGSVDDVYVEFKRRMGSDHLYSFKSAGCRKTPEELSAEVLKSLKGDVLQRLGEDVQAAVITIPAVFEQRQCVATKKAGELAGFRQCPLLQEPVAASLAYGFQRDVSKRVFWLVFDFGGGTFDAAVMKAEDGDIHVVNHGGDNYLGGADIDWAILEKLILPQLAGSYNLPDFKRGNAKWRSEFARIKRAIEEAKIALSRSETVLLENCQFSDADGQLVDLDGWKLTQSEVATLVEPLVERASGICLRVMKEKNLTAAAIEKTVLVGGPTLAPYFRAMLQDRLGIPLDHSVDPLTVVARGAAVFAGTQRIDKAGRTKAVVGQFDISLSYNPVGADEDPPVAGEVSAAGTASLPGGMSIEFVNRATHWRSGKIPLNAEGKFRTRLLAEAGDQNFFDIELLDAGGARQKVVPAQLGYTMGMTVKAQIVSNDIAIALADNNKTILVHKGEPYPFKKTDRSFRTTVPLHSGTDDVLIVPVVEGNNRKSDCNVKLGDLIIRGKQVRRDVSLGSEIELTLDAKEPGSIHVTAYIPMLDEEFKVPLDYFVSGPRQDELRKDLAKEAQRAAGLQSALGEGAGATALERAEACRLSAEERITTASDPDSARQAATAIIEMRCALDEMEEQASWPALVAEVQDALGNMDKIVAEHGVDDQRQSGKTLHADVEDAVEKRDPEKLRKCQDKVMALYHAVLFAQPAFWIGYLKHLHGKRAEMRNAAEAERLFSQGVQFAQRNNLDGVRRTVVELLQLLPEDVAAEVERGYQSGVTQ